MQERHRKVPGNLWLCLNSLLALWLGLSLPGAPKSVEALSVKVAATIFPLYDLMRQVAGPEVEVVLILPPGASPHTFVARPSMVNALTGSAALFAIGHGLDDWAVGLARDLGVSEAIVVDEHITLHSEVSTVHQHGHETHGADPHYWLDPANAVHMVQRIAVALGRLDEARHEVYAQRARLYTVQLHQLDQAIRQRFASCQHRDLALFHPAFGYFAAAYDLHIVATFASAPGQEPTPRQVEGFLQQVRAHQLSGLFIEPQLPQVALRSMAGEWGLTVHLLDPLGGTPGRDSYLALMQFNAAQIAAALCE